MHIVSVQILLGIFVKLTMTTVNQHERVRQLSDSDLRQELIQAGEAVGPITRTTRPLFERKLLRCLLGDEEHTSEPKPTPVELKVLPSNGHSEGDKNLNISQCSSDGDRVSYYGVAVPSNYADRTGKYPSGPNTSVG